MKKILGCVGLLVSLVGSNAQAAPLGWDGQTYFVEPSSPDDTGSLPSDLGPVSIAASRRAIQADITDWSDDRDRTKTAKTLSCALAGLETGILLWPAGTLAVVGAVGALETYLAGDAQAHGAATPLTPMASLSQLETTVPFTAPEQLLLRRLETREVQDVSDRIRLAIDTQSFLMKVAARLYNEQINAHFKRTEGFWGFFRADPEYCAAFQLVAQRDTQLIAAAGQVLNLYTQLEHEIGN